MQSRNGPGLQPLTRIRRLQDHMIPASEDPVAKITIYDSQPEVAVSYKSCHLAKRGLLCAMDDGGRPRQRCPHRRHHLLTTSICPCTLRRPLVLVVFRSIVSFLYTTLLPYYLRPVAVP